MKAAILYDSSAYLTAPLIERSNLFQVDFTLVLPNGEVITESTDEQELENFFDTWMQDDTGQPKTAQPGVPDYHAAFKKIIDEGYDTVFGVFLSSGVSGTFQTAGSVSREYEDQLNIYNFDAVGLSVNMEQLIGQIALMIDQDRTFDEIKNTAESLMSESRFFIALEKNDNLIKGGRGKGVKHLEDTSLKTRTVLEYVPGNTPELREVFRTVKQRNKYLAEVATDYQKKYPDHEIQLGIGHTLSEDKALQLKEELLNLLPGRHINIRLIGTAFCSHLGKGALSFGLMRAIKGAGLDG